jgi:hypothetical protein
MTPAVFTPWDPGLRHVRDGHRPTSKKEGQSLFFELRHRATSKKGEKKREIPSFLS